jgi:O-antigen/teichoic acid export membrane protein
MPFAVLVVLGRYSSSSDYASVSLAFAWVTVAASLTTTGIALAVTQRLSSGAAGVDHSRFVQRAAAVALLSSGSLAVLVGLGGDALFAFAFSTHADSGILVPGLISGCAWSHVLLCVAASNGMHDARRSATILALGGALQGLLMAAGFAMFSSAVAAVWGLALGSTLAAAAGSIALRRLFRGTAGTSSAENKATAPLKLGSDAAWSTLASACVTPVVLIASGIIARNDHDGTQLAAFFALEQVYLLFSYAGGVMAQALLPILTRQFAASAKKAGTEASSILAVLVASGLLLGLLLVPAAALINEVIGNPALTDLTSTRLMLCSAALSIALAFMGTVTIGRGRFAMGAALNVGWAAIVLAGTWALQDSGVTGFQSARLLAAVILLAIVAIQLRRANAVAAY